MDVEKLVQRAESLMQAFAGRDSTAVVVRAMREGRFADVSPDSFSEDYPAPVVVNRIDTMARDATASLSPLPSFNCVPISTTSEGAKAAAAKRTKIARSYIDESHLQAQMPEAVDSLNCYGMLAFRVEPDNEEKMPRILALDGSRCYPVWNKDFETVECANVFYVSIYGLRAQFPEQAELIDKNHVGRGVDPGRIKVVHYENAQRVLAYLPEASHTVLIDTENKMGRCTFVCAPRPSGGATWHSTPRGAYDDLVWPLIAENDLRMLALEATEKAVRAPIVAPPDVLDIAFGADSVLRTNNPAGVRRLDINVPPAVFSATQLLDQNIQEGGMSPGSRTGNLHASVITGRGVDALGEGYSAQIALLQSRIGFCLEEVIELCFEMDEKLWPDVEKEIRGRKADAPFSLRYKPSRDIAGDHSVSVDYGFLLGLDANRALVYILQAQGAGLLSISTAQRYLPISLNLDEETGQIQIEQMRNSLIQAYSAIAQSLPQIILQGQDPQKVIMATAAVINGLREGKEIEKITAEVFAPPPQQPDPQAQGTQQPQPGGAAPPSDLKPNLATEGPNARPDLAQMFAGTTSAGAPNLGMVISRMRPAAGN